MDLQGEARKKMFKLSVAPQSGQQVVESHPSAAGLWQRQLHLEIELGLLSLGELVILFDEVLNHPIHHLGYSPVSLAGNQLEFLPSFGRNADRQVFWTAISLTLQVK